nr:PREDICTED: glutathione S-transferase A-like [Latimeria chalumnae]|eukprot:XP_014345153.1 PREDICTED: glutathione S-transferase A-like [Latimeria chalumnae]
MALFSFQNQFKSQGTQLIPDSPAEQALVYQRMFEVLTLQQKLGKRMVVWGACVIKLLFLVFPSRLSQNQFPHLLDYYNLVKERSSVQASWPPNWKENPQGTDTLKDL